MRKHVKPADPRATILDPVRQRDLPPEGYPVDWGQRWIRLEARGDIIVTEIPDAPAEEAPPADEPAPAPVATAAEPEGEAPHPDA